MVYTIFYLGHVHDVTCSPLRIVDAWYNISNNILTQEYVYHYAIPNLLGIHSYMHTEGVKQDQELLWYRVTYWYAALMTTNMQED